MKTLHSCLVQFAPCVERLRWQGVAIGIGMGPRVKPEDDGVGGKPEDDKGFEGNQKVRLGIANYRLKDEKYNGLIR